MYYDINYSYLYYNYSGFRLKSQVFYSIELRVAGDLNLCGTAGCVY